MIARRKLASTRRPRFGSALASLRVAWCFGLLLWCVGCVSPQDPQAPGGGQALPLDLAVFIDEIEPILQQRRCSNAACHGGQGAGELMLSGDQSGL